MSTPVQDPRSPPGVAPVAITVAGQELTLFFETLSLIAHMVHDIRSAGQRVWLETYIFHDDTSARAVAEALKERARAGVEVRLLYDAIGSQETPAAMFDDMRQAGVQVHEFHSIWEALWDFGLLRILNRRDHRKLLVIDDRIAYFGGMNIVDATTVLAMDKADQLPKSAGWRDVHVRLVGAKQAEVAESFDRSWQRAHGKKISRRPRSYRQALLARGGESIQFFDSGPGWKYTRAARLFVRLIKAARKRLTFSMAYFLPVGAVLRALLRARRRGVFVRVIVPAESDVPLVQHATRYLYSLLLRRRFRIYERRGTMLHSKMTIVDDRWVVLGSCNLDARSLWINLEFLAVIQSPRLVRVLNDIVAYEIEHSRRVTPKSYLNPSWWQWFVSGLAWLLRWWL